ncbi:MAG: DEAD/DEAH box helicase [Acidobacteriota bacterium]|nr:DEAD/DEAH box helicase [Acidobacteriota bacterium]
MKRTATSRNRRRQEDAEPRVSRLHRPDEMSLEEWQRRLRKQFASEQPFRIENIGEHPIFSDYRVTNPARGSVHRVAIRSAEPGRNYCSCPDFRTNHLGTCKHIEFTLATLLARRGAKRAFLAGYEPPYSSISVEYGPQRHVLFRASGDCPKALRRLVTRHFDKAGRLTADGFARFDRFVTAAKEIDPELRIYDDVLPFVTEVRDAARRTDAIAEAFPDGIRSRRFDRLLAVRLYDYQKEGALFAARAGRSLIGDEMGLGKTAQAIAAAEIMAGFLDVERVLVVCPTSLKHQWQREIASFSKRPARVIEGLRPARAAAYATDEFFKITNYDTVHIDLDLIARWSPDLIILDEAQRIKNWSTRTARSVKQLASPYAMVLTGTPLENRIEELVSIVEFIDPFRLGPTFRLLDAHQMRDENGRVVGYRDLDRLGTTLAPVLIRRRKREVMAQLPERLEKTFFVPMTREQFVHHRENEEIVARIAARWRRSRHLSERDQRRLMIALQRMRMSCDSSYLLDEKSDHGTKAGEILTLLGEIFEDPGTKVVIFSQWLRMHEILAKRIAAAGWGHVLFHGGIDSHARAKLVDRFRDDPECRIFLSTDAGGVGLNLQHASVVINVDLPWNPAVLEQRIGRVHRIGQRAPVRVVNFVAEGTIEQGMLSVLRFKKSLFAGVLDGGETEVFLGKGRLDRFMESIERVTAEIQAVPVPAETPADAGVSEPSVPEAGAPARAEPLSEPLVDPLTRLLESGVGFLRQLEAALPAESDSGGNGGKSTMRRIEARQDADGSTFLAVPMPSREAVARFTDGLAALLRSMLP